MFSASTFIWIIAAIILIQRSETINLKFSGGELPPSSWSGSCLAVRRYTCIAGCVLKGCYHAHCERRILIGKCSCQLCGRRTLDPSELNCRTSRHMCDQKCGEKYSGRGKCMRDLVAMNTYTDNELCSCWVH